jgi:hypothetical protein
LLSPGRFHSYPDRSLQVSYCPPADRNPVSPVQAEQFTAPRRELPGLQFLPAEALGPVGDQGAVGRTGDRVLGDACPGGKETGNKVAVLPGCGDDDAEEVQTGHLFQVGLKPSNLVFLFIDHQQVSGPKRPNRKEPQYCFKLGRRRAVLRRAGGKIHHQQIPPAFDRKPPASGLKLHPKRLRIFVLQHGESTGQRSVSA